MGGQWFPQSWLLNGGAIFGDNANLFNLTPIKPKWCEDDVNFPVALISVDGFYPIIVDTKENYNLNYNNSHWRLATKQEVESLYYEGKQDV